MFTAQASIITEETNGLRERGYDVDVYSTHVETARCFPEETEKLNSKHFVSPLTLMLQTAQVQLGYGMVKIRKRILKRSYKKKQYRYERYYLEIPSRFNDLIAELYGKKVNLQMEKTQNELCIKLRVDQRMKTVNTHS